MALVEVCGTVVAPSGTWNLTGVPYRLGLQRENNAALNRPSRRSTTSQDGYMTSPWEVHTAEERDLEFLQRMLYEAANRPGDDWPPLEECVNEARFRRFWVSWPRAGDIGVVARDRGAPIGAAWIRRFTGEKLSGRRQ